MKAKYIIRLDDASHNMDLSKWNRIEKILDDYNIKPIVGVIPDNEDKTFRNEYNKDFWKQVIKWQRKGWEISIHGLNHKYHYHVPRKGYFQLSHSTKTEFAGLPYDKQKEKIEKAIKIFNDNGIKTRSFFSPSHTFDESTVDAVRDSGLTFISDGYSFRPYIKKGVIFVPSICDGPFSFPLGIFTFVFHPENMGEREFSKLIYFLKTNSNKIVRVDEVLKCHLKNRFVFSYLIEVIIFLIRWLRNIIKTIMDVVKAKLIFGKNVFKQIKR